MNTKTFTLDFLNADTGLPLVTVRGSVAKWFAENSAYIREIVGIEPEKKGYTIHVSLPTDRALILGKILRGEPLGVRVVEPSGIPTIVWHPLGPLEEADIQAEFSDNPGEINKERGRVIQQVLQYLMIDPDVEGEVIQIELRPAFNNSELEEGRRERITLSRKNRPLSKKRIPYLNENTIEKYVEGHKNYIYKKYLQTPNRKTILQKFMTKKNIENRNNRLSKHATRHFGPHGSWKASSNRHPFNDLYIPSELGINKNYPRMKSVNFEKYLRSLRGRAEKNLPYQGNFHLENLFGNQSNV